MGTSNLSNRTMIKYPKTKSDPICKWRNATPETVVELVSVLPKEEMSKADFRLYVADRYDGDFFHTAYQLAAQLSLYYEDDNKYIPRFDHNITITEATDYLYKWMERYYVPNPFTKRGFIYINQPIVLLDSFGSFLEEHPNKNDMAVIGAALIGGEMGNLGNVKYVLNEFSRIIEIDKENKMSLLASREWHCIVDYDRNDKMAFFNHFK